MRRPDGIKNRISLMNLTGKNIIGSRFSGDGNNTFQGIHPATTEPLAPVFYEATAEEIDEAVAAAEKAFNAYQEKAPSQRAAFLEAIATAIDGCGEALIQRCREETALPEARLHNERNRTVNQLRLLADVVRQGWWLEPRIDTAIPDREPVPKPDVRQMLVPLGPVAVFGASNFPLAFSVAGGDTASAFAAGCPVVVKAHPAHPGTSELVGNAIVSAAEETGMPEGVFSMLHGQTPAVGMGLVTHPLIRAVAFTGSFRGGKALFDTAMQRDEPIPVYAEMGSVNPLFILPGALKERSEVLAEGLFNSVTLGVGQFCTNPGLFFVIASDDAETFMKNLARRFSTGSPGTMLSPTIRNNYDEGRNRLLSLEGVDLVAHGEHVDSACAGRSALFRTTADTLVTTPDVSEEVFGPSTVAIFAEDKNDLCQAARNLSGNLTGTIQCTEDDLIEYTDLVKIMERKVGRLLLNDYPTGVEVCHSMHHGGPFPATTDVRTTSVGTAAIKRFGRPLCYQNTPDTVLPPELQDGNPLNIWRMVNGKWTKEKC